MGFSGLNISVSGLLASQAGLEVTSNNIANANTEGYSRRMIHFSEGITTGATPNYPERLLSGVQVESINRVRNTFLDNQVRQQNSNFNYDQTAAEIAVALNDILGEPSDSGLSAKLTEFFQAASDLAANPEVATAKTVFINAADSLTQSFNQIDQSFEIYKSNLSEKPSGALPSAVTELNSKLEELYIMNQRALAGNTSGQRAEDLNDKVDLLLDEISELMEVEIDRSGSGDFRRLRVDISASEARATGTVNFLNSSSPIPALTAGNNSLELELNNGNGTTIGPFNVNFEPNSTPEEVVDQINKTFKAAGGQGTIASLDESGQLNIATSLVTNSENNTTAEVNIVSGLGTTLATLGLTAGTTNGSNATSEVILDNQELYLLVDVEEGNFDSGVDPNRIQFRTNDPLRSLVGTRDPGFGGKIGAYVDMTNEVVPEFQKELSDFAMSIKDSVNKILQLGTTTAGNPGAALFTGRDAGDFGLDRSIVSNPGLLAQGKTSAISDGAIMAEISDLFFGTDNVISDLSINEELFIDSPSATAVQSQIAIIPGENITIHADGIINDNGSPVNAGQNGFGGGSLVQLQYRDASGAAVGGPIDFPASTGAPESRVSFNGTVPAGAATLEVVMNNTTFNDNNITNNEGHFSIKVIQGNDPGTATSLNNKMADVVGKFGTLGNLKNSNASNSGSLFDSLNNRRQSIMGVSVEEEASTLIQMQNAFAANARVVSTWDEIYQTILNM